MLPLPARMGVATNSGTTAVFILVWLHRARERMGEECHIVGEETGGNERENSPARFGAAGRRERERRREELTQIL